MKPDEMHKLLKEFADTEYFEALEQYLNQKISDDANTLLTLDLRDPQATKIQGAALGRKELIIELEQLKKTEK